MDIHITARHFKAHDTLRDHAHSAMEKLSKYYKNIIKADIILSYEKPVNSIKVAELHVTVQGAVLTALEKSDDFVKSIDAAVEKIERQLLKNKEKHQERDNTVIRQIQAKA